MDYLDYYTTITEKFLDPGGLYSNNDDFYKGYNKALAEAKSTLTFSSYNKQDIREGLKKNKDGKFILKGTSLYKTLNTQFKERLLKEYQFMIAWQREMKKKKVPNKKIATIPQLSKRDLSIAESTAGLNKESEMELYALRFNNFIREMISFDSPDDEYKQRMAVIQTMRTDNFAKEANGVMTSVVYSRNTVMKYIKEQLAKGNKKVGSVEQELLNFYRELYDVFFFNIRSGATISAAGGRTSTQMFDLMTKSKNASIARRVFEERFKKFVKRYYHELEEEKINDYLSSGIWDNLDNISKIFGDQVKNEGYKFKFGEKNKEGLKYERGVSSTTQTQLKKMLNEVFRQISKANNMSNDHYKEFNEKFSGLIRLDEVSGSNLNGDGRELCYKELQMTIDVEKAKRTARLKLKAALKKGSEKEKIALLADALKDGVISEDEFYKQAVDMRHSNVAFEKQIRSKIMTIIFDTLRMLMKSGAGGQTLKYNGEDVIIKEDFLSREEPIIRRVAFKTLNDKAKTGKLFLDALTAYGYESTKGLWGEIAEAYELYTGGIRKIQVTGSETDRLKMQKHYDIVVELNGKKFGVQVKNVKTADEVKKKVRFELYRTEISLAEKAMYRYFSEEEVKVYRWLFANGQFLEEQSIGGIPNVKELMLANFITAIPTFLRISNAAETSKKAIDSDIYIIGNRYYPSSFFIYEAYKALAAELVQQNIRRKVFRISGNFPDYYYKADPNLKIEKGKYSGLLEKEEGSLDSKHRSYRINSRGRMSEYKGGNLVVIDKSQLLYGKKIIFSGIALKV